MKWNNLKENKCPICGCDLLLAKNGNRQYCENKRCQFQITNNRLKELNKKMSNIKQHYQYICGV